MDRNLLGMENKILKKVVYSDNGIDKAIVGTIIGEDDFFVTVKANEGEVKIGKKAIVKIEEYQNKFRVRE